MPACGGLNNLVNILESGVFSLPLGKLYRVCMLIDIEGGSVLFFKLVNSSSLIGFRYNVLYSRYSRLDEVRYRLETGVDEVLDVLRYSEVLDVVEPVEPVVGAVKDWGLGSWRGHGEERSIYG